MECCAHGCYNTTADPGIQFLKLPEDHKHCGMLLKRLGREDLLAMPRSMIQKYIICSLHLDAIEVVKDVPNGDMKFEYQTQFPIEKKLKYKSSKYRERYSPFELSKSQKIEPAPVQMKPIVSPLGTIKVPVLQQGLYSDSSKMQENLQEVHKQDYFSLCEKCGILFPSLGELYKHQAEADSITIREDSIINLQNKVEKKSFTEQQLSSSSSQYSTQLMTVNPEKSNSPAEFYPCNGCLKKYKNQTSLQKHIKRIHIDSYCSACGKVFKSKYYLQKHQAEHCAKRFLFH